MLKVLVLFVCIATVLAGYNNNAGYNDNAGTAKIDWWDTDDNKEIKDRLDRRIPFPQCLVAGAKSNFFESSSLQKFFDRKIREEEADLRNERRQNSKHGNDGVMDYNAYGSENHQSKSRSAAAAITGLTREIMTVLACDLNGTDSRNLDKFLEKFKVSDELCSYRKKVDCQKKTKYRTATGLCNNHDRPYDGSSQTAYKRMINAVYQDHLSEPRRLSRRGGPLPSCRQISLALGTKPLFDREYNNFFAIYGQYMGHDISLATPVSDTYLTPISSCTCGSKYDWNKCTVIDIKPDDPYLGAQKCMAFPATAQAFKNQVCSLGVKEQMNGNTHGLDLSNIYGSTQLMASVVRSRDGKLKSSRVRGFKKELPPAQREQKSCSDASYKESCLTGGDSRVMINLLFTGIQAIFLREHNTLAKLLHEINPHWSNNELYEEARKINIAFFQRLAYAEWFPILFGPEYYKKYLGDPLESKYNSDLSPIVYNEVATAAFRLHTLVRDLFSRCTPDGKRIDQIWLHDISTKVKQAYNVEANGLDSILCGSFYDYGFSRDGNFAHQLRDRLFETTSNYKVWRNDLIAINICRGREHGIPPYNEFREHCGYPRAYYFRDFGDTINYDGIKLLERLYQDPADVDLFVALNLEDSTPGSLIGPTTACLLGQQFKDLRDGDRLFYSHPDVFTKAQLKEIQDYPFHCFICENVDIEQVPKNPFKPPHDKENQLQDCSACEKFKLDLWKDNEPNEENHSDHPNEFGDRPQEEHNEDDT